MSCQHPNEPEVYSCPDCQPQSLSQVRRMAVQKPFFKIEVGTGMRYIDLFPSLASQFELPSGQYIHIADANARVLPLQEENARLKAKHDEYVSLQNATEKIQDKLNAARAEVERLRAELTKYQTCERGPKICDELIADLRGEVERLKAAANRQATSHLALWNELFALRPIRDQLVKALEEIEKDLRHNSQFCDYEASEDAALDPDGCLKCCAMTALAAAKGVV